MKVSASLFGFNRGLCSSLALARTDVDRTRLSAEVMTNWLPRTQGPMQLRPGTAYLGTIPSTPKIIPFVAATDDTALLEITDSVLRIWIDDELLTRAAVSTAITTGNFSASTGWTETDTGGADSTFTAAGLTMNATNRGGVTKVLQQVTVGFSDRSVEHALRIVVARGPVTFRCGSTSGGDEYVSETALRTGTHSLAFTPTGNFYVQFQSNLLRDIIVTSMAVEGSGIVSVTAPWLAADLSLIRWDQSADVVFVACDGYQTRRIERRGTGRSWSVVLYAPEDGPFSAGTTASVKLTPGATYGNTTLTSDQPFFKSTHVGALFRLFHNNTVQTVKISADNTFSDPLRINAIGDDNDYNINLSGTWLGTLTIERSLDSDNSGFSANQTKAPADAGDNAIITPSTLDNVVFYDRIGFEYGDYTSGAAVIVTTAPSAGYGICRVTSFVSSTQVNVEVLKDFKNASSTDDWKESIWSDYRGWPTSVALHQGRLFLPGRVYNIGSVSDDYESFDDSVVGDSGPIIRTIGSGPVDVINWALSLRRLILGTAGAEISVRSSSLDEPLTPENNSATFISTQGSAKTLAAKVDTDGLYIQRSQKRVFKIGTDPTSFDEISRELTLLVPDISGDATFEWVAVQRQPDTRIHIGLSDGTVCILSYDPNEDLLCWSKVALDDGSIIDAAVLPGVSEDQVYYVAELTVSDATVRYLYKWAMVADCVGGTLNKQLDGFVIYDGIATATPSGLGHLEGRDVAVWANGVCLADGNDVATFAVSSGSITLPAAATNLVIGEPYTAQWKSTKLAYGAVMGTALTQPKKINKIGLILENTHHLGLKAGRDFEHLQNLPQVIKGKTVDTDTIHAEVETPPEMFDGSWDTDARLCLEAQAPRPCTVLAAILAIETKEVA